MFKGDTILKVYSVKNKMVTKWQRSRITIRGLY